MQNLFERTGLFVNLKRQAGARLLISGSERNWRLHALCEIFNKSKKSVVFICGNDYEAKKYAEDLSRIAPEDAVLYYPKEPFYFSYSDSYSREVSLARLKVIDSVLNAKKKLIVASIFALSEKFPSVSRDNYITYRTGDELKPGELTAKLAAFGYERCESCEAAGQFAVRGGIIDFFSACASNPVRVEFWGDEIDSARNYDPLTLLSVGNTDTFSLSPFTQYLLNEGEVTAAIAAMRSEAEKTLESITDEETKRMMSENSAALTEKLSIDPAEAAHLVYAYTDTPMQTLTELLDGCEIVFNDGGRVEKDFKLAHKAMLEDFTLLKQQGTAFDTQLKIFAPYDQIIKHFSQNGYFAFCGALKPEESEYDREYYAGCADVINFKGNINVFAAQLPMYIASDYSVIIAYETPDEKKALESLFTSLNITCADTAGPAKVSLFKYKLAGGMDFAKDKVLLIPYRSIISLQQTSKKRKPTDITKEFFSDINPGDYVVHEVHGIGRYEGISQIEFFGVQKDYIKISYANDDTLYVPPEQMDLIQKYVGSGDAPPRISRMGSGEWNTTKRKVKKAVTELAQEYINMYAERQARPGYSFSEDTPWQAEFESRFEFEPTEDQLKCTAEIKADMEKSSPMDRLLLGDVGFGKTEVAARAAFKAVMEPKQVAVLVPTTILALQHYNNFTQRFAGYPIKIEMLSRFRSAKQTEKTVENIAEGKTDIVIGTHRLLSKDVVFKDLGLLIVDEEQRFGVAHKDKLKLIKTNLDTLTLSATPIPRTLNMSLTGILDMSVISTPPENKLEVQTFVTEQDDAKIKQAINFELSRGGQVFYLYNRVEHIQEVASHISALVPDARVAFAHGQMAEGALEKIILGFLNREFDVLVSTTIIENGVDIINANTIIVQDADRLGLSQLYQLRGRVGRRDTAAFAYMMYKRDKALNEDAAKRLSAIKEFTKFGSGFKIAMRDLQIRGAGNVLGANQSGHFANVGYEMYCRMLGEAISEASGEKPVKKTTAEIDLRVSAYLPNDYVQSEAKRIELYKTIAAIENEEDYSRVADEITDVYSDMPQCVVNLLKVALIKAGAVKCGMKKLRQNDSALVIDFDEGVFFDASLITKLSEKYRIKVKNTESGVSLTVRYDVKQPVLPFCEELINDFVCNAEEIQYNS